MFAVLNQGSSAVASKGFPLSSVRLTTSMQPLLLNMCGLVQIWPLFSSCVSAVPVQHTASLCKHSRVTLQTFKGRCHGFFASGLSDFAAAGDSGVHDSMTLFCLGLLDRLAPSGRISVHRAEVPKIVG